MDCLTRQVREAVLCLDSREKLNITDVELRLFVNVEKLCFHLCPVNIPKLPVFSQFYVSIEIEPKLCSSNFYLG